MRREIAFVIALAIAPAARADEPIPAKARELAETGRTAHEKGDYPRAIAAFKEAYVMAPSPALLFNLAQAYRLQGDCDDAELMYRRYLASGPSDEGRMLAQTHLATVERCIRKRSLRIPMDESQSYLAIPNPPKDLGIVDSPTPQPHGTLMKDVGFGLVLGGTAAAGIATYYAFRAHADEVAVEKAYGKGAKWQEVAQRHADGEHAATAARLFGIGGGAALLGGATLYILGRRAGVPLQITPTTGTGVRVSLQWSM
jgi:tetratricopeptide (TPR) repeat protein